MKPGFFENDWRTKVVAGGVNGTLTDDNKQNHIGEKGLARVAVEQGELRENVTIDVTGPETFRYKEYIGLMAKSMGLRRLILPMPSRVGWLFGKLLGLYLQDLVITMAEIRGLKRGLMSSDETPLGQYKFSEWINEHGHTFGNRYQNDLKERKYSDPKQNNN